MRGLNYLGNRFFAGLFSYLLNQRLTDTLCGTKGMWRADYERLAANRKYFGDFDPFGDFGHAARRFEVEPKNRRITRSLLCSRVRRTADFAVSRWTGLAAHVRVCLDQTEGALNAASWKPKIPQITEPFGRRSPFCARSITICSIACWSCGCWAQLRDWRGAGALKARAPDLLSSDIQHATWLDFVADAQRLPFGNES